MTFLRENPVVRFIMAVLAMVLAAGCAESLVRVPRDGATFSDLVDNGASDVLADQVNVDDVMDAGDEPVFPDVPKVEAGEDGDVSSMPDREITDGGGDVSPDLHDVAQDDGATDVMGEMPVDASPDADSSAPCPIPGQATCSGRCTSIATDPRNCGTCDRICSIPNGTAGCAAGACTVAACNPGFGDCDGIPANGCEVNLVSTALHCGVCNNACAEPTPLCSARVCSSGCGVPGETRCGTACINTQTNSSNCGGCGNICAPRTNGSVSCVTSTCRYVCNPGFHDCGGVCVDNTAVATCGASCMPCAPPPNATATCTAGSCGFTCVTGFANCDGVASNGCEVNLQTDPVNCGRCAGLCERDDTCVTGACINVARVASGGHVGSIDATTDYPAARSTGNHQNGMVAVFSYREVASGRYTIGRGYLLLRVPRGTILSASVHFVPPYGIANCGGSDTAIQLTGFTPTSLTAVTPTDYGLSHWGDMFLSDPEAIPCADFVAGSEINRTLNAAGVTYLQALTGRQGMLGLRTTHDLNSATPPASRALVGVELGSSPAITTTIRYRPPGP